MGAGHDHGGGAVKHEKPLWWALGLTAAFLVAEVIGGLLTKTAWHCCRTQRTWRPT